MLLCRGSLGLLCCAHAVLGLRAPPPKEALSLGPPSIVLGGIGDSGTSAVISAIQRLGLVHCKKHNVWEEPESAGMTPDGFKRVDIIRGMLELGHFKMTQAAYQTYPMMWEKSLEYVLHLARMEGECIQKQWLNEGKLDQAPASWGFKEPHFGWLLPSMDAAYELRTKYLIIARDPRDVCNGLLQDQFQSYGEQLWITDCYIWWAKYWNELLNRYESTARLKVLRIEDLVVPDPTQGSSSFDVLQCVLNFAGLASDTSAVMNVLTKFHSVLDAPGPLDKNMMHELEGFHNYSSHYLGHRFGQTGEALRELERKVANHTDPILRNSMLRLGYNFTNFGLLKPASVSVCSR
mmetsp:Transcript_39522/g.114053  ORF Transcript_39522/g.114053 Transcript_39522/m.114053 type:complete len:349 (-) Transcript_39522:91-1137(-)